MIRAAAPLLFIAIACATAEPIPACGAEVLAACTPSNAESSTVSTSEAIVSTRKAAEEFLADRLSFWQQRLSLQEWKVQVVMTPGTALKPRTLGGIKWDKSKKTAVMAVLDSSDYSGSVEAMLRDMEFTVVHELIHLELASLPKSEASRRTEEHAVNNLAKALLALHCER